MVTNAKEIAIIGGSLWGNRGAAAMLETSIFKVRESLPDAKIDVFTPYPEKDRLLAADPGLNFFDSKPLALIRYFLKAVWGRARHAIGLQVELDGGAGALTGSDLLLDIGGITFADGRLKFLPYNILTIWPSILYQVPVVKLSQAAGSFRNPILRISAKYFLSRCQHIFARGEKTKDHLESLGLTGEQITLAADIAFGYQPAYCLTQENSLAVEQLAAVLDERRAAGQRVICFSPSVLVSEKMRSNRQSYNELVLNVIRKSDYKNQTYLLLPNATREGSRKTRNNDLQVIKELRDQAELELPTRIYHKIIWVDYDLNSSGVHQLIQRTNIVIASRFHTMVASLRSGKPTLIIGWGHKYQEVMRRFGQGEFVFDYRLDPDQIVNKTEQLLENESLISSRIERAFQTELIASLIQFEYIAGAFLEN